jgi:hypothetical protein
VEEVECRMKIVNFISPCNVSFKRSAGLLHLLIGDVRAHIVPNWAED